MAFTRAIMQGARPGWRMPSPQPMAMALRRPRRSLSTPPRPVTAPARSRTPAATLLPTTNLTTSSQQQQRFGTTVVFRRLDGHRSRDMDTEQRADVHTRESISSHCLWGATHRVNYAPPLPGRSASATPTPAELRQTSRLPPLGQAPRTKQGSGEDIMAPPAEFSNRYARVPSIYSVIQGFSSTRPVSSGKRCAATEAGTDSEGEEATEDSEEEEEARKRSVAQYCGPRAASASIAASAAVSAASAVSDSCAPRAATWALPPIPDQEPPAERWSLAAALRRMRTFLNGQPRETLNTRPLDYVLPPGHKQGESQERDRVPAALLESVACIPAYVKPFSLTQRLGAVFLSSLNIHPPVATASASALTAPDVTDDVMPDSPCCGESGAYDECSVYEGRGGDHDDFSTSFYERSTWKQDAFSDIPAALLRCRPESEFPSSYRRQMNVEASAPSPLTSEPPVTRALGEKRSVTGAADRPLSAPLTSMLDHPLMHSYRPAAFSAAARVGPTAPQARACSSQPVSTSLAAASTSLAAMCTASSIASASASASALRMRTLRREAKMLGHDGAPRSDLARLFSVAALRDVSSNDVKSPHSPVLQSPLRQKAAEGEESPTRTLWQGRDSRLGTPVLMGSTGVSAFSFSQSTTTTQEVTCSATSCRVV